MILARAIEVSRPASGRVELCGGDPRNPASRRSLGVVIAATLTKATVTPLAFLTAFGVTLITAVPFILMGLSIGYALPSKAAIVVAQLPFFPLAFGGGLMTAPGNAPGFVENLAPYLPTGGAVRLMWAAVGDFPFDLSSTLALAGWTAVLALVAVLAYRRDEGRRFT